MALAGTMRETKEDNARIKAAAQLLNRGWGTPKQEHEHGGRNGSEEIKILIRTIVQSKADKK